MKLGRNPPCHVYCEYPPWVYKESVVKIEPLLRIGCRSNLRTRGQFAKVVREYFSYKSFLFIAHLHVINQVRSRSNGIQNC